MISTEGAATCLAVLTIYGRYAQMFASKRRV